MTNQNLYDERESLKAREVAASDAERQKLVDIEDEILAAPIESISDIAIKLEIITARAELFDVSDDLERLHDQIVAFRASESLAPPPCNWYAT
jgi:hypothetical protein